MSFLKTDDLFPSNISKFSLLKIDDFQIFPSQNPFLDRVSISPPRGSTTCRYLVFLLRSQELTSCTPWTTTSSPPWGARRTCWRPSSRAASSTGATPSRKSSWTAGWRSSRRWLGTLASSPSCWRERRTRARLLWPLRLPRTRASPSSRSAAQRT